MDIELYYEEKGAGKPLILLHGNNEDGRYFKHQIEHFSRWYRVIAVDTRGHGRSPRGSTEFSIRQFADDLYGFMRKLEIEKAHILGFSDGGNIALIFAMKHPEMVDRLILNGANLYGSGVRAYEQIPTEIAYRVANFFAMRQRPAVDAGNKCLKKEEIKLNNNYNNYKSVKGMKNSDDNRDCIVNFERQKNITNTTVNNIFNAENVDTAHKSDLDSDSEDYIINAERDDNINNKDEKGYFSNNNYDNATNEKCGKSVENTDAYDSSNIVDGTNMIDEKSNNIRKWSGMVKWAEMLGLMVVDPDIKPEELENVMAETLVIAGTRDMIKKSHTELIAEKIPDSKLVFVSGNHFAAGRNPAEFNAVVEEFLNR